jgi:hypothetical protein
LTSLRRNAIALGLVVAFAAVLGLIANDPSLTPTGVKLDLALVGAILAVGLVKTLT